MGKLPRRLCVQAMGLPDRGRSGLQDEAQGSSWNGSALPEIGTQEEEEEQFGGEGRRTLGFQGRLGTQVWCCHCRGES